jgi:hypothetical protein
MCGFELDIPSEEEQAHSIHLLHENADTYEERSLDVRGGVAHQDALCFCASLGPQENEYLKKMLVGEDAMEKTTHNGAQGRDVA